MSILWSQQNPPLKQKELDQLEAERSIRLPTSYREFIYQNRGGYTAGGDDILFAPNWNETPVSVWYGAMGSPYGGTFHNRHLGNFSESVSRQFLQFAEDPGGQIFVIDLRPGTYGKFYVRDHDGPLNRPALIDDDGFEGSDHEEAELYHPIAASFEAFLELLGPDPDAK